MSARRWTAAGIALLAAASLSGCAYTSGLMPSAGANPNVYFAQSDVLTNLKIPVLVLPACTANADNTTQTCKGTTMTNEPILVEVDQTQASLPMTIKVGDKVVFTGSAMDVVKKEATAP